MRSLQMQSFQTTLVIASALSTTASENDIKPMVGEIKSGIPLTRTPSLPLNAMAASLQDQGTKKPVLGSPTIYRPDEPKITLL